eukprot:TRINITY_DN2767_c0_g1_i3.p1 TRINITY_DN2767_c0_g1~~TRINITY_DN2767_c0_g1_i3.p1  ORF type:complete len:684 (-),score=104.98 TRINITY_DN2767_c0_g1_i3:727-2778(-)
MSVTGTVKNARNLISKSKGVNCSPYCVVGPTDEKGHFNKKTKKFRLKSKAIKRSTNPDWELSFEFPLECPAFKIEVKDFGTDEFMGQVVILDLDKHPSETKWYRLTSKPGQEETVVGEMHVSYTYKSEQSKPTPIDLSFDIFYQTITKLKSSLEVEGLFRLSGSDSEVKALFALMNDPSKEFTVNDETDPHAITGALKLYLRNIENPLIPYNSYDTFIDSINEDSDSIQSLKESIANLPETNRLTLTYLIYFLNKVTSLSETNKMNANNLGIVFGPTIMRNLENAMDLNAANREKMLAQYLIENFEKLWDKSEFEKFISEYESKRPELAKQKPVSPFLIFFPGGKKTIVFDPKLKLYPILDKVCQTSSLNIEEVIVHDGNNVEITQLQEKTLGDIPSMSITLRDKKTYVNTPKEERNRSRPISFRLSKKIDLFDLANEFKSSRGPDSSRGHPSEGNLTAREGSDTARKDQSEASKKKKVEGQSFVTTRTLKGEDIQPQSAPESTATPSKSNIPDHVKTKRDRRKSATIMFKGAMDMLLRNKDPSPSSSPEKSYSMLDDIKNMTVETLDSFAKDLGTQISNESNNYAKLTSRTQTLEEENKELSNTLNMLIQDIESERKLIESLTEKVSKLDKLKGIDSEKLALVELSMQNKHNPKPDPEVTRTLGFCFLDFKKKKTKFSWCRS